MATFTKHPFFSSGRYLNKNGNEFLNLFLISLDYFCCVYVVLLWEMILGHMGAPGYTQVTSKGKESDKSLVPQRETAEHVTALRSTYLKESSKVRNTLTPQK